MCVFLFIYFYYYVDYFCEALVLVAFWLPTCYETLSVVLNGLGLLLLSEGAVWA